MYQLDTPLVCGQTNKKTRDWRPDVTMDRLKVTVEIEGEKETLEVGLGHSGLAEDLDFVVSIENKDLSIGTFSDLGSDK